METPPETMETRQETTEKTPETMETPPETMETPPETMETCPETMGTPPFACGICGEKFGEIVKFYMHLGEHNVLIQKEFHVCDVEVPSKTEDISRRVKNDGEKDSASTTASYICKACSCTFATLCLLHNHLSGCFESGSYVFDAEHNTAHPIKSICSFFEARKDIHDTADIMSNSSDCEHKENEDHSYDAERNNEALNNIVSLESDSGKIALCVKEKSNDVNDTEIPYEIVEVPVNDKTGKTVTKKEVSTLTDLFGAHHLPSIQYTKIENRKGRKRILKELDGPKQNLKQKIVKTEKRKVKRHASKRKSEQRSDDKSIKSEEEGNKKILHKCEYCGKEFKYIPNLKLHLISHTKERTHKCELCNRAYKYKGGLHKHMLSHSDDKSVKSEEGNKKILHTCEYCGKEFKYLPNLKLHQISHTKERAHKCELCNRTFKYKGGLHQHMLSHSDDKSVKSEEGNKKILHKCEYCGKEFKYLPKLKLHQISHTKERTQKCEQCNRTFKYKGGLQQHMLSHSEDLSYCCEICGERFPSKQLLSDHNFSKHVTEKPYKCDQCGAAFKTAYRLSRHAKQHSGRQHQCEVCGMGFTREEYLNQHRLSQHDQKGRRFPCNQCDRRFLTNYQLQCHLKVHSGERPFPCKLCTAAFIQRKELRKHMKTRHGLNLEDLDIAGEAETDNKAFQTGLVMELPSEVVEDGLVYDNVEKQSDVYCGMDTQSTDYQREGTQSTVILSNIMNSDAVYLS